MTFIQWVLKYFDIIVWDDFLNLYDVAWQAQALDMTETEREALKAKFDQYFAGNFKRGIYEPTMVRVLKTLKCFENGATA